MKALNHISTLISRRPVQIAALGAVAFAAQVACSGEPVAPNNNPFPTAGSSAGGTPGASGSGTSGGFGTSGTGFGTAGTETGGTGGAGTAGTGGAGGTTAGTAGSAGGPPVVVVPPFCEGMTPTALPFDVQSAFFESSWQGDFSQITIPMDLVEDACMTRPPGAVGRCSKWRYTPSAAVAPTWAAVAWVNRADANYTHDPVCLATGATRISFWARGVKGGEIVSFGGGSALEVPITLSDEWREYEVPLEGVTYTTPDGVQPNGFSWKVDPGEPAEIVEFFIDSIQFVTTPLVGNGGGGGEGGSGAGGDSGMGGGEN